MVAERITESSTLFFVVSFQFLLLSFYSVENQELTAASTTTSSAPSESESSDAGSCAEFHESAEKRQNSFHSRRQRMFSDSRKYEVILNFVVFKYILLYCIEQCTGRSALYCTMECWHCSFVLLNLLFHVLHSRFRRFTNKGVEQYGSNINEQPIQSQSSSSTRKRDSPNQEERRARVLEAVERRLRTDEEQ